MYQTNLELRDEQLRNAWAFASKRYRTIISCSKQAKALGVRVGMRYEDALEAVPDIRIMLVGKTRSR